MGADSLCIRPKAFVDDRDHDMEGTTYAYLFLSMFFGEALWITG
ncbi:hypothetical protein OROGR_008081 [Orobanche gracilis]